MKNLKCLLLGSTIAVLNMANMAAAQSSTGETTIFVGSPGSNPNRLNGYGVSTSDIDPILDQYTGLGAHFTRDISNDAFDDLADLKQNVRADLTTAINSINRVSVNSLSLTINPIKARLTQNGTSVGVRVGDLDAFVSIRYNLPWPLGHCNGSVSVSDISIGGSYNVFSGEINDSTVNVALNDVDINCSGIVGLFVSIVDIFVDKNALANNAIEDGIRDFTGFANMQTLFSISDFLDSTRSFGETIENTANNFPQSVSVNTAALGDLSDFGLPANVIIDIPQVQGDISDEFNMVVDTVQQIIGGFAGTSLQLDISVYDGPQNQISFVASHQALRISSFAYAGVNLFASLVVPPNTNMQSIKLFTQSPGASNWVEINYTVIAVAPGEVFINFDGGVPSGTKLAVIGENSLISGLYNFPQGNIVTLIPCQFGTFCDPSNGGGGSGF